MTDYHDQREYLVEEAFRFHPAMLQYLDEKYHTLLHSSRQTVSVHFRILQLDDPFGYVVQRRQHPSLAWYFHVMEKMFTPKDVTFVIFAENATTILPHFVKAQQRNPDFQYRIVDDENFAVTMAFMTLCDHHVVTSSTFGFWGMSVW